MVSDNRGTDSHWHKFLMNNFKENSELLLLASLSNIVSNVKLVKFIWGKLNLGDTRGLQFFWIPLGKHEASRFRTREDQLCVVTHFGLFGEVVAEAFLGSGTSSRRISPNRLQSRSSFCLVRL